MPIAAECYQNRPGYVPDRKTPAMKKIPFKLKAASKIYLKKGFYCRYFLKHFKTISRLTS